MNTCCLYRTIDIVGTLIRREFERHWGVILQISEENDGSMVNHSIEVRFVIFQFNIEVLEVGVNLDVLIFRIFSGAFCFNFTFHLGGFFESSSKSVNSVEGFVGF